ncbi:MAG: Rne/Rng family ribonuclease [Zetaproteobacteria bacterium]|nr:Rne/Rng family ribonuclease [Zetaproteobacteria bacterium]
MSVELLVNASPFETRIVRIENGRAEELYIERERERGLKGNIYKGKVQRVLPGIQAAFIDIGLEKAGFLYAGDIATHSRTEDIENTTDENSEQEPVENHGKRTIAPIASLLREQQEVLVQVSKEPISSKGPRLTSLISLAGRHLVYLPGTEHIGIARRMESIPERERLLEIAHQIKPEQGGLIIRTVAEGHSREELEQDLAFLLRLWHDIENRCKTASPGTVVHTELNLYLRVLRDYVDDDVEKIHIDSKEAYHAMKHFAAQFMPEVADRLYYYPGDRPVFDLYGVESTIAAALKRQVPLKSGGYLVIDQTEALIAIDVNSGSFTSSHNMEETGFKTNLEAVHEIVHHLRLRNLGGIIVLDFIDMQEEENKQRLMQLLEKALERDKSKTHIAQFSTLGLIEMTRKRTRDSLERILLQECHSCHGSGREKSLTTICYQMFRDVMAEARAYPCEKLMVIANPLLIDLLLGEESEDVTKLEHFLSKEIVLKSDSQLAPENYEIALL